MKRVLSVWFPEWPIDRLRRSEPHAVRDDRPFALVEPSTRGILITAINDRARTEGVRVGQTLADARAAFPRLSTRCAERAKDQAALLALARWSTRYGPAANSEGNDGLWIDVTGVPHLFGGEASLMRDLLGRLAAFGLTARAALADTGAAAFALARFAPPRSGSVIVSAGRMMPALADLPVEALNLDDAAVLLLKRLGLRRIGQLYTLPRPALAGRFRELSLGRSSRSRSRRMADSSALAGRVLARLDLALGRSPEPRRPLAEPPHHLVRSVFPDPLISAVAIESAVARQVESLSERLERDGVGGRRLRLALFRVDGTVAEVRVGTSAPCREPHHFEHLLKEKLPAIDAGFGIDVMTLEAVATEPLAAVQRTLTGRVGSGTLPPAVLIDRLANRLGSRLFRLSERESHIPERAQTAVPALARQSAPSPKSTLPLPRRLGPALAGCPPLLLDPPEPISVIAELPEGPPARFQWRRVSHRVTKAEGPERIEPEWWCALGAGNSIPRADKAASAGPPRPRDYYRLEDQSGGRYWVFREGLYGREGEAEGEAGAPRWYMHGMFG
jgi:protein ImuB